MRQKTKLVLWFIFGFSLTFQVWAQERISLTQVLQDLENQYQVEFNYAQDNIEKVEVSKPDFNLKLDEILKVLEKETKLKFTVAKSNIVIITQIQQWTFCGYIKSRELNEPLEQVTIQSKSSGTTTDKSGFFNITLKSGEENLTIRSLGFKAKTINVSLVNDNTCKTIFLDQDLEALSEVFLTNYITTGISKNNLGAYEIDFSKFDILPGLIDTDVLQSVQAFPGIVSVDETVSNINIRGGSNDQNLMLWDGIKMYQTGHFFGLISLYNPQITKDVLLVKNGTNASFTDGVSGTVLMKTNNEVSKKTTASLGVNLVDFNGYLDLKISDKSSVELAARKSLSDFTKTPTFDRYFERITQDPEFENNASNIVNSNEDFDFYDFSLRWLYEISPKDKLRVNFINASNKLVFDEVTNISNVEQSRQSELTQNSIAGLLFYNRTWNNRLNTSIEVYETDYKLQATNANLLQNQRFLQKNQISESSVKLQGNYQLNDLLNWNLGYHFTETEITNLDDVDNPIYRFLTSRVLRLHAAFSGITYKSANNKTHINLGLRYNYIDKFNKSILEPRLSLTHRFWNNFSMEILGEFKNQTTSQIINFQNDFLGVEKRRWQLSNNQNIPVIKSKQLAFGLNYSKNNFLISSEFYVKYINGITTLSQGFTDQYQFFETNGNNTIYGLDLLVRKSIKDYNFWLSYAFMENTYTFKAISQDAFPSNFDIKHTVTFGTSYTKDKFKFSFGINWHTGKPVTKPVEGNSIIDGEINYESVNSSRLDSYFRSDLSAMYTINISKKIKGQFAASIWNVLSTDNIVNSYYSISNNAIVETNERSLKFTPNISARFML